MVPCKIITVTSILFFLLGQRSCQGSDKQSRLLVSDPTYLLSQLESLTREVNTLKTVSSQENQVLKSKLDDQNTEIASLRSQISTLTQKVNAQGSTFTVWGKKTCPSVSGTENIYSGIASGSNYADKGNGVNTLCMPHDPEKLIYGLTVINSDDVGHIYGSEYQFSTHRMHIQEDVPCAVCRVETASSTIMIPGKLSCPPSWRKQYTGFLTSNWHAYQGTEYLCLDLDPDFVEGSRSDQNGRLFYPVRTVCGSLPCPPYENGDLVSCVICSK
ncbi:uncharacterized protein LOC111109661 [Crassostrea virginica]